MSPFSRTNRAATRTEETPGSDRNVRVELYLRQDTYGTFAAQQRALDRLEALDALGCAGVRVFRTMEYECREMPLLACEAFENWARANDVRLASGFERRQWERPQWTDAIDVATFPVVRVAICSDHTVDAVFPCTDDGVYYSVGDCLGAFESGQSTVSSRSSRPVRSSGRGHLAVIGAVPFDVDSRKAVPEWDRNGEGTPSSGPQATGIVSVGDPR